MNINEVSNDGLSQVISIHVVEADYAEKKKKSLNKARREADIKGFRKGTAPMSLIERIYGGQALSEALNELIGEGLDKYIQDNNLQLLGEPLPIEEAPAEGAPENEFDFKFEICPAPKFELKIDKDDKITTYKVSVGDKEKAEYKKGLCQQYATLEDVDEVAADSFAICEFSLKEKKVESVYVAVDRLTDEAKDIFKGKKKDAEFDIDIVLAFPNETDRAAMLHMKKEELAEIAETVWHVKINSIRHYVDAKEDQDLYDKAFGKDKVKSAEEYDAAVAAKLEEQYSLESEYRFGLDVKEYLMKKAEVKVPEAFLRKWVLYANKGKITEEQVEKEWPMFVKDFAWQQISNKIAAEQNIKVEKEDLLAQARRMVEYQYAMYGMNSLPEEYLNQMAAQFLSDERQAPRIYEKVEQDKVIAYVKGVVTLKEKKISAEELRKLND